MRGSSFVLGWALLALALALPAPTTNASETETLRLLNVVRKDADPVAWAKAVRILKAGTEDQRARVLSLLARMAEERHQAWVRATARVDALAARVGDGSRAEKRRRAWEEAKDHARAWIFDEERFPVPTQTVITGPQTGYAQAKRRGDAAIRAHEALARMLDRALAPALGLSRRKAQALRSGHAAAEAAYRRVATEIDASERSDPALPAPDPLAVLLLRLRLEEFPGVAEAYAGMAPGWRRLCLFHAWCRAVLEWNEDHAFGMRKDAIAGIREINEYRRALGISPVVHNEKLVRTAFKHSEEMTKLGYFSHRSPVPERATKEMRAAVEGYPANVVECITGVGGGATAVAFWKYDGGHHRDMVHPKWVEGGFSTRGPAVYVGGMGEDDALPTLEY